MIPHLPFYYWSPYSSVDRYMVCVFVDSSFFLVSIFDAHIAIGITLFTTFFKQGFEFNQICSTELDLMLILIWPKTFNLVYNYWFRIRWWLRVLIMALYSESNYGSESDMCKTNYEYGNHDSLPNFIHIFTCAFKRLFRLLKCLSLFARSPSICMTSKLQCPCPWRYWWN